ncbi:MAG: MerR family transcriptional regulator [Gallionellales bacterium CG_4_10_14_3_um_filter_54_96]|nr:MAG: MerR family transcriptional regulator [Gallionellales bacterium CG03_land_8_20_14_0_80_55_15]PIV92030.1 MAG: MerR family transcriptional regulator [Gallionellales bacterium CG17_big_fil_post_rev_8_21_14_2_50_54_146]PIX04743.1 MAG: MerR family transcriptional regulator [Gallionellales bacterium CG_4_8_14_3_um_filter_54_18]PIY05061.1 MAG: MerR family transcriptional regulator [Gallionellales bacterium CG_4_10_14_3_um_filter_54_96]PJC05505.1 MAG: MerR family transcriptional regulator [Gall
MDSEAMRQPLSGLVMEAQTALTLSEICAICAVHTERIIELVEEGILIPIGRERQNWRFTGKHIRRASVALRLQRDLGINLAGVALALQLLDEVETLRAQLSAMDE